MLSKDYPFARAQTFFKNKVKKLQHVKKNLKQYLENCLFFERMFKTMFETLFETIFFFLKLCKNVLRENRSVSHTDSLKSLEIKSPSGRLARRIVGIILLIRKQIIAVMDVCFQAANCVQIKGLTSPKFRISCHGRLIANRLLN